AFTCEASALRGAILTAPAIEPITANRGQAACKPAKGGLADATGALPVPLSLGAAAVQTTLEGSDAQPGSQVAGAIGGLLNARVRPLGLPQIPIPVNQVPTVTVPLFSLPAVPGVPRPPNVTVDLKPALQALVGQVTADVLRVQAGVAFASARCVDGSPQLAGSSQLAGLSVLGIELPTDKATEQSLKVLDTQSIDPSNIDVSQIPLPPGVAPELLPFIQQAVKPLLDALPTISIPATLASVKVTPDQTLREGDKLTQRALQVQVSLLGQRLADLVVGEASVSAADVPCAAATQVSQEQLACTKRRLALVDVLRQGRRVKLFGVADRALIGQRVSIRFTATGREVARPVVRRNGEFSATAPLPPAAIRATNRARYQAVIGRERSLDLKLVRRMVVTRLTGANGKVTISGRVIRPLGSPIQTIVVKRRVSCRRTEVVRRIKPSRTGAFRVTVDAPPQTLAATYRLSTRVRKFARNPKLYNTYTLPRAVEIQK
ncbi:MAG: hypothetical protein M3P50_02390, partial [Actinomycetota bacterium]|nr:hypothetical protein [Actinomycetota bacterium]